MLGTLTMRIAVVHRVPLSAGGGFAVSTEKGNWLLTSVVCSYSLRLMVAEGWWGGAVVLLYGGWKTSCGWVVALHPRLVSSSASVAAAGTLNVECSALLGERVVMR
jgi:hypothetical protein